MISETATADVTDLIAERAVAAVYQPIVSLDDGSVVGWEALARGPAGSPLESPAALFDAARSAGVIAALDRVCREAAVLGATQARLDGRLLFVNVEPAALDGQELFGPVVQAEVERMSLVVELTERALAARPAEVIAAVRWLRERGCRIALDDVGIDERSLALMPFVAPDVIKLDRRLTQEAVPAGAAIRAIHAVGAEAERSGAVVLAEGIETEEHLARARALGATFGQGWMFGRPGPLGESPDKAAPPAIPTRSPRHTATGTPFERVADLKRLRMADKRLLLALSRQFEREAAGLGGEVVVLATFQDASFYTHRSRESYERLARRAALVGALGAGMPVRPGHDVRGASIAADDELRHEWDVIVISPHFAGAFVARDLGDGPPDHARRFEYFLTYDRELVAHAAQALLERIVPDL